MHNQQIPSSLYPHLTLCVLRRRRMSCEEALAHSWMAAFDSRDLATTKCLSKEKMKRFLARQKWKVTHLTFLFFLSLFSATNILNFSFVESR